MAIEILDYPDRRAYLNPETQEEAPSVTTILGGGEDWFNWRLKKAIEAIYERAGQELMPINDAVTIGRARVDAYLMSHADAGTALHKYVETGQRLGDTGDPRWDGWVNNACDSWDQFLDQSGLDPANMEHEVRLMKDGAFGPYGGTVDLVIKDPKGIDYDTVVELKTSRDIQPWHALQAAAYAYLWAGNRNVVGAVWVMQLGKYNVGHVIKKVNYASALAAFNRAHANYIHNTMEKLYVY